jgi:hypothetical protein
MRLPVLSLRFDLADASDADLAQRLEACIATLDELGPGRVPVSTVGLRGPVRHPLAYRVRCLIFDGPTGTPLDLLISLITLNRHLTDWLLSGRNSRRHLTVCEIHDLQDEIRRRLGPRGRP